MAHTYNYLYDGRMSTHFNNSFAPRARIDSENLVKWFMTKLDRSVKGGRVWQSDFGEVSTMIHDYRITFKCSPTESNIIISGKRKDFALPENCYFEWDNIWNNLYHNPEDYSREEWINYWENDMNPNWDIDIRLIPTEDDDYHTSLKEFEISELYAIWHNIKEIVGI